MRDEVFWANKIHWSYRGIVKANANARIPLLEKMIINPNDLSISKRMRLKYYSIMKRKFKLKKYKHDRNMLLTTKLPYYQEMFMRFIDQ